METTVTRFADFIAGAAYDDLSDSAVKTMKWLLLDTFGCAVAGMLSDKGKWGIDYARKFFGGQPQARALGYGDRLSLFGAAFVNGELINGLDYEASNKHLPPLVLPCTIAVAEMNKSSGKDFLLSSAIALEVGMRLGKVLGDFRDIKKDGTTGLPPVTGYSSAVFGGAAGVAKLEHFDREEAAQALGMAGLLSPVNSQTPMHRNVPTTSAKYLMAGWAAQAGLSAPYLVRAGHRGDISVLDGDYGYWKMIGASRWDAEAALEKIGEDWMFARMIPFKQYPCCRIMHGALDCVGDLIRENSIDPASIESIHVGIEPTYIEPVFHNKVLVNQTDAQFCVPYNVAVHAYGIRPGVQWQTWETMHDPKILALMDKVTFGSHPDFVEVLKKDPLARLSSAEIMANGKRYYKEITFIRGTAGTEHCLSDEELTQKFMENTAIVLPTYKAEKAYECMLHLDDVDDVTEIMDLFCL